ncbi:HEAT repeat domain-containing protein [Candidatus Micrarchaeota archaeon]|nr:HEAT repeat domain-containing protein [Candidatus Micrarchaeota archaeon]
MDVADKWVQLAYDSDPEKRLKAAKQLADSNSPFAMFALLELSVDKDENVRKFVRSVLKERKDEKTEQSQILSDLLIEDLENEINENEKQVKKEEDRIKIEKIRKKLEPFIEKCIEAKDPEKIETVKKKLMPMVEQIIKRWADREDYLVEMFGGEVEEKDVKKIEKEDKKDVKKYLEMILSAEKIASGIGIPEISSDEEEKETGPQKDTIFDDEEMELDSIEIEEDVKDNPFIEPIDRALYNRAIKIVSTPGITKKAVDEQKKQIKKELQLKVKAVFSLAAIKSSHRYIEWLDELDEGMNNIYTKDLEVISVEDKIIKPARGKGKSLKRIVISDGNNEFPVYLWKGRGDGIFKGEKVRLENASVEMYPMTEELVLTLDKKDSVLIVLK